MTSALNGKLPAGRCLSIIGTEGEAIRRYVLTAERLHADDTIVPALASPLNSAGKPARRQNAI